MHWGPRPRMPERRGLSCPGFFALAGAAEGGRSHTPIPNQRIKLMKDSTETRVRLPQNFFKDLADKERITLFNTGKIRAVGAKELLFKKGSADTSIYCVLSG